MTSCSVAVIGGGAVGITAAYDLARRGADVTLYERSQLAGGSTGRAAGIIYDVFASDAEVEMAANAYRRFEEFEESGKDFEFSDCPFVWFAREGDEESERAIRDRVQALQRLGRDVDLVEPAELEDRFTALRTDDMGLTAMTRTAGYADPHQYSVAMSKAAEESGVEFELGTSVAVSIEPPAVVVGDERHRVDAVVVAAGVHTRPLLAKVGIDVPVKPYRVQAMTCRPIGASSAALRDGVPIVQDKTDNFYYRPDSEGILGGGGPGSVSEISDVTDWSESADLSFVTGIAGDLENRIPEYELEMTSSWAGLCAATPDQKPLVGEVADGIVVAAGWQGHGFMRAPAAGELVADAVLDGRETQSLSPTRFDEGETFEVATGMGTH
jgi:glycine/D-amino acid oxidase-like deaminating enzyme